MTEKPERDFKGVWIPKELYLYRGLSWTQKLLLIEIDSLDRGDGCWARDKHFAEHLSIAPKTVRNIMSILYGDEWINIEYDDKNRRRIKTRCPEKGIPMSRNSDSSVPKKGLSSNKKEPSKNTCKGKRNTIEPSREEIESAIRRQREMRESDELHHKRIRGG